MPNRSFWIEAKESLEQNAKTMPMSSRILGIGIIFVAFIVLSIGLIVGLKFPGFVEDRIKEDQCVVSEEYSHYNQWEFDEQWIRYEKLYFWNITNRQNILLSGAIPSLEKCGPYIYKKTARKVNVVFRDGYVSFKYLISFNFDEDKTQEECGINCKSSDEITMLDTDKIEEIGTFKSSEDYLLGNIPDWINSKIEELSVRQTNISENVFSLLGLLNNSANTENNMDHLVQNISFGRWIGKNDTEQKIVINKIRNYTDFSETEMTRLYNALSSAQVMGLPLTQESTETCRTFVHTNTCSQHLIILNSSTPGLLYPSFEDDNLKYYNFRNICGLLLFIQSINESNINCFLSVPEWLSEMFCFTNDTDYYQNSDISTASQHSIYNTYFIQPLEDLKTCTSQTPAVNSFLHFSEEFACAIDIEPLSGKIWRKTLCRQKKISFFKYGTVTDNVYRLNISTYSFSTFLRESRIEISSSDVERFKTRIEQMLDASCVGMISLTVIASGVFILAVCILCWPQAKRKVHPFILEQSHNLAHSRL
ncbi:uncharacterized protein LOC134711002 [Mytilus trossulus]|uniref:uncharacterized protein LOC134711002 n=1 Tax=Mytilus trossulus TaxID=6551 RepID=UPI003005250A